MQTKDLRYTPAKFLHEHQRWCMVLDVPAGASHTIMIPFAMQYGDVLHCYDISSLESTAVQFSVRNWLLDGVPIQDTFEHLRLPLQELDALHVQIPVGFVGQVLLLRVRSTYTNPKAPELIRLGALLHLIQQEPTAAIVYKHKVKPLEHTSGSPAE